MEGKWPMTMLYSLYYEFGKTFPFSRVAGIRDEATSAKSANRLFKEGKAVRQYQTENICFPLLLKSFIFSQ